MPTIDDTFVEMSSPTVSVIIPTYERPHYLRQALGSALAQTFDDFEIIVADDHSSSETRDVVRSFDDPRIRYLRSDSNLGFFDNSIGAYQAARGRYVATLHDDDIWETRLLERLVTPLEADEELVVTFCDQWLITSDGATDLRLTEAGTAKYGRSDLAEGRVPSILQATLVNRSIPLIIATIVRRDAIAWNDVPRQAWRIFELWLLYRLAITGRGAWYCSDRLARYRVHGQSATALAGIEWHECSAFCWEEFLSDERLAAGHDVFRQRLVEARTNLMVALIKAGRMREARAVARSTLIHGHGWRTVAASMLSTLPQPAAQRVTALAAKC